MTPERVVIVGGGIIGAMHALEACRRDWEVIHLEADPGPRRASLRNFGLVWVSGRAAGPELEVALRARQLLGDTHAYDEPFDFAVDETVYDHLKFRAEQILGWRLPLVTRRWAGVYTLATDDRLCYREQVDTDIWVVTGLAGRGMTLSPAIAEQTWQEVGT